MRSLIRNKVIQLINEEYTPPKPNFIKKVRGLLLTVSNFDYEKANQKKEEKESNNSSAASEDTKSQFENSSFGNFYLDFYGIKHIDGYEDKCKCIYREGDGFYEKEDSDGKPNPKEYEGDHIDFENREIMSLSSSKMVISAGGDWQPMHYITIKMKDNGDLYIDDCKRADDSTKMTDKRMKEKEIFEKLFSAPFK